jgi:NAD(P)-dependent dehydrogenase (short-subunit alcohol dehydrogenase family)|tara:strand:+ start:4452 stop:5132 length:681 start_codon:yes stop_codon:yes gene_type:complete
MKKIVITGHSKGIGKQLSEYFLKTGYDVYGISRTKSNNKNITQFNCDILDHNKIKKIFKKIKKFDVLINNSSITKYKSNPYERYIKIINTNLIGTYSCCLAAQKHIKGGSIINISSINAHMAFPNNPGYVSSKGGIKSLTQALALDYSKFNIRVNSLSPGYINEGMSKASYLNKKKNYERLDRMIIKRWGKVEDLVGIIEYLFSDKSSYVTGQDFIIDGGWTIKGL